ncbi:hypothetical protein P280DRAFT_538529 [Massarina eburnea CBS 473.64]|uniref:DUF4246 domain-containing protein n=1 Tax=Massarina eburnea CBS 473.64 TaxID=1395130 RepID=A0A6A6RKN4_9PLEO|nr:hypothetical protein P280DRAFT_538529 [Massarina eburnea CBS 473.64]
MLDSKSAKTITHRCKWPMADRHSPSLQNYGNVETKKGTLLAFPNSQRCVSPFQLVDKTRPGHHRFIALRLVDSTKRVISTANVPP